MVAFPVLPLKGFETFPKVITMINFEKLFENLSPTHYELVSKFKVKLKPLLQQALSESEFYCDLIYKFKKKKKKKKIKKC